MHSVPVVLVRGTFTPSSNCPLFSPFLKVSNASYTIMRNGNEETDMMYRIKEGKKNRMLVISNLQTTLNYQLTWR